MDTPTPSVNKKLEELGLTHISTAANNTLKYIDQRRKKTIRSFRTPWRFLNEKLLDGIEWNTICLIAARSGIGKSHFVEQLAREGYALNPEDDYCVLNFNFEMPSMMIQSRNLTGYTGHNLRKIFSTQGNEVTDEEFTLYKEQLSNHLVNKDIYYVDFPKTTQEYIKICKIVYSIVQKPILVISDHTTLFKTTSEDTSYKILMENIAKGAVEIKKTIPKSIQLFVSQLNREIESVERRQPKSPLNYPDKSCIREGDGLYNACDLVMILNSPAKLQFKPGSYGPLALSCGPKDLYLHVVKSRVSSDMIVELTDDLEHARIVDRVSQPITTR